MPSIDDNKLLNPYKGKEPYIFISYAHKNSDEVFRILARLQHAGYRVWYDQGIDPGSEFEEFIASHITECGYFIAFVSAEYKESDYCKDEIRFARSEKKPLLMVYLQPAELSDGMKMRLNSFQSIHKYKYENEEVFYEKLFETQGLNKCLDSCEPISLDKKDYAFSPQTESAPAQVKKYADEAEIYPVPVMKKAASAVYPQPKADHNFLQILSMNPDMTKKIIIAAAAVLAVIILLIVGISAAAGKGKDKLVPDAGSYIENLPDLSGNENSAVSAADAASVPHDKQPYENVYTELYDNEREKSFSVFGTEYNTGMIFDSSAGSKIIFNNNENFTGLTFSIGRIDNTDRRDVKVRVYFGGEESEIINIENGSVPQNISLDISGVKQITMEIDNIYGGPKIAVYNMTFSKK